MGRKRRPGKKKVKLIAAGNILVVGGRSGGWGRSTKTTRDIKQ